MSTPLEETFDLPPIDSINETIEELVEDQVESTDLSEAFEMQFNTPATSDASEELIRDYATNMKTVFDEAMAKFEDVMDTAMNMEAAHGSKFIGTAAKFLDIAKNSQNEMVDRYNKLKELQMKEEKHISEQKGLVPKGKSLSADGAIEGDIEDEKPQGVMVDRNELL